MKNDMINTMTQVNSNGNGVLDKKLIKGIVFDVDGTLYPNKNMYIKMLVYAIKNAKLLMTVSKIRKAIRKIEHVDNFYQLQSQMFAKEMNIDDQTSAKLIQEIFYDEWLKNITGVGLFKDCITSVEKIKTKGYKLGILSDFPIENKMEAIRFPKLWDIEVSAEQSNYLKPNPQSFLICAEKLGLQPQQILYIGNSYHYDVCGAKNVGMIAAHVSFFKPKDSIADFTFYKYKDLLKWLDIE